MVDTRDRAMREDVPMPKRKRRSFTPEQKADAVRMVREVGSACEVARRLDLTETALRTRSMIPYREPVDSEIAA